jgi:hypothetical protein
VIVVDQIQDFANVPSDDPHRARQVVYNTYQSAKVEGSRVLEALQQESRSNK